MEVAIVGRKHGREDDELLSEYPSPSSKKSSTHSSRLTSDEELQRLRLLEDLYGLNAPSPDPDVRDDVVSEMMRSLERVITGGGGSGSDEFDQSRPAPPQLTTANDDASSSTSNPFHYYASFDDNGDEDLDEEEGESSSSSSVEDPLTSPNDGSGGGVDLTFLLQASDDELGIPTTPPEQEKLCSETASEDFSWLETAYTAVSSHSACEDEDIWRLNLEESCLLESRICDLGVGF